MLRFLSAFCRGCSAFVLIFRWKSSHPAVDVKQQGENQHPQIQEHDCRMKNPGMTAPVLRWSTASSISRSWSQVREEWSGSSRRGSALQVNEQRQRIKTMYCLRWCDAVAGHGTCYSYGSVWIPSLEKTLSDIVLLVQRSQSGRLLKVKNVSTFGMFSALQ